MIRRFYLGIIMFKLYVTGVTIYNYEDNVKLGLPMFMFICNHADFIYGSSSVLVGFACLSFQFILKMNNTITHM